MIQRLFGMLLSSKVSLCDNLIKNFNSCIANKRFLSENVVYEKPFTMSSLSPLPGSRKRKKRKGRGESSQLGRQCGRGTRALHSKRTHISPEYEGGRLPFYFFFRNFPKLKRYEGEDFVHINIGTILLYIKEGYLDPNKPITMFEFIDKRLVREPKDGIKILGRGYDLINIKLHIEATKASKEAIQCIERNGGTFKAVYVEPEILKCWADYKHVENKIECAYDLVTKIPYKINADTRRRMINLQKLTGTILPNSIPPSDKLYYYFNSSRNGFLSKKIISQNTQLLE